MARITPAKPLKKVAACSAVSMAVSSSNEAPAQKGPVPPLRSTSTFTAGSAESARMVAASSRRRAPGRELDLGWKNSTVPIPWSTVTETVPSGAGVGLGVAGWVMRGKLGASHARRDCPALRAVPRFRA